jgi:hypothetical protein
LETTAAEPTSAEAGPWLESGSAGWHAAARLKSLPTSSSGLLAK